MPISRRSFLQGMMGLGGAIVAGPAICKAENLMKIIAPPKPSFIWTPDVRLIRPSSHQPAREDLILSDGDWSMDFYCEVKDGQYKIRVVRGVSTDYSITRQLNPQSEKLLRDANFRKIFLNDS